MKPIYKTLAVSALALTVALPAMAQTPIDTQANAQMQMEMQTQAQAQAQPQQALPKAQSTLGEPGTYASTSAAASTRTGTTSADPAPAPAAAPIYRDPQVATMMQPQQKPVDPMDYKDTQSLQQQTGFVALNTGNEISEDNISRGQAGLNANAAAAVRTDSVIGVPDTPATPPQLQASTGGPALTATHSAATMMNPAATVPAQPVSRGISITSTEPSTGVSNTVRTNLPAVAGGALGADSAYGTQPGVQSIVPAASNAAHTDTVTIRLPSVQAGAQAASTLTGLPQEPTTVNRSVVVVGNSDTGVDLNSLAQ